MAFSSFSLLEQMRRLKTEPTAVTVLWDIEADQTPEVTAPKFIRTTLDIPPFASLKDDDWKSLPLLERLGLRVKFVQLPESPIHNQMAKEWRYEIVALGQTNGTLCVWSIELDPDSKRFGKSAEIANCEVAFMLGDGRNLAFCRPQILAITIFISERWAAIAKAKKAEGPLSLFKSYLEASRNLTAEGVMAWCAKQCARAIRTTQSAGIKRAMTDFISQCSCLLQVGRNESISRARAEYAKLNPREFKMWYKRFRARQVENHPGWRYRECPLQLELPICEGCGKDDDLQSGTMKKCGKCQKVVYCSKMCQRDDWMDHKYLCRKGK